MKTVQVAPSILSADFARLQEQVDSVVQAGCEVLHLDIMDGHYVPNLSFGPMIVRSVRKLTNMELEAHLMISNPDKYLQNYSDSGSDVILVHPSTCPSPSDTLSRIHDLGAKAGLVINPDEAITLVEPFLQQMDQLLIMSVFPGFGGQKFMPGVLEQLPGILPALRDANIILEIDGGINMETISPLKDTGINRFVAGSAVFNRDANPGENYLALLNQLSRD